MLIKSYPGGTQCISPQLEELIAQSVIQAIPIFAMQMTRISRGVLDKIDWISRRFIWGRENAGRKLSLISWETICTPKAGGGLGLKNLTDTNNALLVKIGWNVLASAHCLWIRVLGSKYGLASDIVPLTLNLWKITSRIWTSM